MQPRRKVLRHLKAQEKLLDRLRSMRAKYGLTQAHVAKVGLNISRAQYTALENGRSMMSFDHLVSLSLFYRCSLSDLLYGVV